uniref:Uncharacterized protein n=1 Tax=Sphaerodactylus townsendi TaxID=933632 RepID=A0ACB8G6Q4_9SAUR
MAGKDEATGGSLAGEPDEGTGQVPDTDEMPCDLDLGDEKKDAPVPNRHNPHLGVVQSTNREESMESSYSWAPSQRPCWWAKAAGRCESTWLTQPMDWDSAAQTLFQPQEQKLAAKHSQSSSSRSKAPMRATVDEPRSAEQLIRTPWGRMGVGSDGSDLDKQCLSSIQPPVAHSETCVRTNRVTNPNGELRWGL